ncbi:MAG TPA: PfkB family carbohydrate kinase [Caulobacteraceae bacterium]
MPLALILSSHVAASRVGGSAQALALAAFGIEPVAVPSVLFGRHPGWGAPGGAAVPDGTFAAMLEGIEANGLFPTFDLVITGYFASAGQVEAAARAVRACTNAQVVVDPVMGDTGKGLYVKSEVAEALKAELVPLADVVAPNAWELEQLTGMEVTGPGAAVRAARALKRPTLVSSVDCLEEIGVVYADAEGAWLAAHPWQEVSPSGTGDLLTALFAAALLDDLWPSERLARAVSGVALAVETANKEQLSELPLAGLGKGLTETAPTVRIEEIA